MKVFIVFLSILLGTAAQAHTPAVCKIDVVANGYDCNLVLSVENQNLESIKYGYTNYRCGKNDRGAQAREVLKIKAEDLRSAGACRAVLVTEKANSL